MLYIKVKKVLFLSSVFFAASLVLFTSVAHAQMFGDLTSSGNQIFTGMRDIIYAVSGFGIMAIAVAGFFGNLNWKWLSAIIIGLVVIATTAAILKYMVDQNEISSITIQDTLIRP
jgi:hypothetical protein